MGDFDILIAKYNSTLPTLSDGDGVELQVDQNGRLLVQADVTVLIDFLGLNGAADNANILVVGTEDGTSSGTAHALRLTSNGSVVVDIDDSTPIDVNVTNTVTVEATDLDIRQLVHTGGTPDSVQIGDGTEILLVNADGSINAVVTATDLDIRDLDYNSDSVTAHQGGDWSVEVAPVGSENFQADTNAAITKAGGFADVVTVSIAEGATKYLYGYQVGADKNVNFRVSFDGSPLKLGIINTMQPVYSEHFSEGGRIELVGPVGGADLKIEADHIDNKRPENATAFGSLHLRDE